MRIHTLVTLFIGVVLFFCLINSPEALGARNLRIVSLTALKTQGPGGDKLYVTVNGIRHFGININVPPGEVLNVDWFDSGPCAPFCRKARVKLWEADPPAGPAGDDLLGICIVKPNPLGGKTCNFTRGGVDYRLSFEVVTVCDPCR